MPLLAEEAKERQRGGQGGVLLKEQIPEAKGQARDQAAKIVGVNPLRELIPQAVAPGRARCVAYDLMPLLADEAKARQLASRAKPGEQVGKAAQQIEQPNKGRAAEQAANRLGN
jgi:hypothetical protein